MENVIILLFLLILSSYYFDASAAFVARGFPSAKTIAITSTITPTKTTLQYDSNPDRQEEQSLDTSPLSKNQDMLFEWLHSLSKLERSEPEWVGGDILSLSPSMLVQEHLESLVPRAPTLFPTEWSKAKFDFEWRTSFLKNMPSSGYELPQLLRYGRSNSHPLRLQLVAVPPQTQLQLHADPATELDIPLLGDLWERRSNILLRPEALSRQPEHSIGTPLSNFSETPTPEELLIISNDLSKRAVLKDHGAEGIFVTQRVSQGHCLVNAVGSVHQSFTSEESPCLLLVLGANVHAHFLPGNFHQREGIQELVGIEHLLE